MNYENYQKWCDNLREKYNLVTYCRSSKLVGVAYTKKYYKRVNFTPTAFYFKVIKSKKTTIKLG